MAMPPSDDEGTLPAAEFAKSKLANIPSHGFSDEASLHAQLQAVADGAGADTLVIWPGDRVELVVDGCLQWSNVITRSTVIGLRRQGTSLCA